MEELLKNLINIQVSLDNVVFTAKWMVFWPMLLLTGYVYWRAVKSFIK